MAANVAGKPPDMADCGGQDSSLWSVPLLALNVSFRKKLALYLNPRTTVAADWSVVAEAMDFTYLEIKNYEAARNPTAAVLEEWQARCSDASVGKLLSILAEVERNDIVEDLQPMIGATLAVEPGGDRLSSCYLSVITKLETFEGFHVISAARRIGLKSPRCGGDSS